MIHIFWFLTSDVLTTIAVVPGASQQLQQPCRRYSISNRPSQDCSSLNLSALPSLFTDVISLNLAHNSLPIIDRFPRNYSYLHTLRLENSGIKRISVQALSSLDNIRVLDLSRNQLRSITFGTGPRSITTLNLAHNSLRYMPDLSALTSLRYVDLSNNEIETVKPSYLPPNVESLRLSANKIAHLTPWPFLRKLQELDVSFNPLECACPLWEFIGWAESLALFQEDSLPCQRPKSLRRSPSAAEQMICGPEVMGSPFVHQMTLSIGDSHRMCCIVSAHPEPSIWWEHEQRNVSKGVSHRRIPESGQIEMCLEVHSVDIEDLGVYRCYAQLEDVVTSKEFQVNRAQEPLVLKSPPNIIFYCQFSIGLFIFAFCCATCCILRRGRPMKTGPKKDIHCHTVVHIMEDKTQSVETTATPSCCGHEHYHAPDNYCTAEFQSDNEDCLAPAYEYAEARRCLQPSPPPDDVTQRRITLWRHRIAAMPAPLAQFDKETNIMGIVHTSV